jgi:hypothetical protein
MFEAPQVEHPQRAVHVERGGQSRYVIQLAVVKNQRHHHHRRVQVPIAHVVSIENENGQAVGCCPGFVPWITIGEKTARYIGSSVYGRENMKKELTPINAALGEVMCA